MTLLQLVSEEAKVFMTPQPCLLNNLVTFEK